MLPDFGSIAFYRSPNQATLLEGTFLKELNHNSAHESDETLHIMPAPHNEKRLDRESSNDHPITRRSLQTAAESER